MKKLLQIKTTGTLSEKTYEILKNAIIGLDLVPGELITVEEISGQLGVSRTPIRTALNRLINDDLIEMIPGKGTYVTCLTEKKIEDLLSIRELLEGLSVQIAAALRTDEELDKLEYLIYKQELSYKVQYHSQQSFLTYDSEFHCLISQISKNTVLEKHLMLLNGNFRRYLNAATIDMCIPLALDEHREIYEQIKKQDSENAKLCMYKHLRNIKFRLFDVLNNSIM